MYVYYAYDLYVIKRFGISQFQITMHMYIHRYMCTVRIKHQYIQSNDQSQPFSQTTVIIDIHLQRKEQPAIRSVSVGSSQMGASQAMLALAGWRLPKTRF